MPQPLRHRSVLFALAIAMAAPLGVAAQDRAPPPESAEGADHRALSDAVRRVERATNGQVLSAERVQFDGRDLSRVKVIDDGGRVRVYWDDPQQARRTERTQRDARRERAAPEREARPRRAERDDPRDGRPQRTRRHDGAAFNL